MSLPRLPGQKENRYFHLLSGEPDLEKLSAEEAAANITSSGSAPAARISELEEKVEKISRDLEELKEQFQQFKKQFE
jgi:uncharacterized protein YceH (UPF0502 family)